MSRGREDNCTRESKEKEDIGCLLEGPGAYLQAGGGSKPLALAYKPERTHSTQNGRWKKDMRVFDLLLVVPLEVLLSCNQESIKKLRVKQNGDRIEASREPI
ncbi:hypothetical protein VNO77_14162 [Canavalia gladiata]|uniref:Uncharacterized protein n=1 Tax=Canavalia gladiata TaxID=3824 RepID=A0AAN9M368_CANGL